MPFLNFEFCGPGLAHVWPGWWSVPKLQGAQRHVVLWRGLT